jgi:hypothetical protein
MEVELLLPIQQPWQIVWSVGNYYLNIKKRVMQFYIDITRETDPYALPDAEVFFAKAGELDEAYEEREDDTPTEQGWYWWSCFPGCLPDSEPCGPFASEEEAMEDAREVCGQ